MARTPVTPAFVKLVRGTHPLALPKYDLGPLPTSKRIENLSIVFKMSPQQQADHDALLAAQLDPGSPSYHQWLTPETYAARFGAKPQDIARTNDWLASKGFTLKATSRLGARVRFGGSVGQLQDAFQAEMHSYNVAGATHYAMATAPSIPSELSDVVLAVYGTHDFYPHAMTTRKSKVVPSSAPMANCPTGNHYCTGVGIAPPDWAALYNVPAAYDGSGVNLVVVGVAEIAQSDISAFRTTYGLPANTVNMILVPGTGAAVGENGAGIEAILDTEYSGGIAQRAQVNYVYVGTEANGNVNESSFYAIEENIAGVMSESFGGCELGELPSDQDVIGTFGSAANLEGITFMASSGDDGAAACLNFTDTQYPNGVAGLYVNEPAAYPGVTGVGGTEFPKNTITFSATTGYATGYDTSEEVWNESSPGRPGAGGGGISTVFSRPSYQSGLTTCTPLGTFPTTITPSTMRQVPDVSFAAADADNPIIIECTLNTTVGDCTTTGGAPQFIQIGGTSASSPAFAGVVAILDQAMGGRLGNINPLLYTLNTTTPGAFHDITTSNNEIGCTPGTDVGCPAGGFYGYAATAGYDCASGLGSLDVTNLVNAWKALAPTTTSLGVSPATTSLGANVTLTATVNVPTPNANTLSGTVTFAFESYLTNGQFDDSWTLGTGTITGANASTGTATFTGPIPPGLIRQPQEVQVVAMYGGDSSHLASTSTTKQVTFGSPLTFCIYPAVASVAPGATFLFAGQGVAPIKWYRDSDSTCNSKGVDCSSLDETNGVFTAGTGQGGYVLVEAIDSAGQETFADITVGTPGAPAGTPPWDDDAGLTNSACAPFDAGPIPSDDAGEDGGEDSGGVVVSGDSGTSSGGGTDSGGPTLSQDSGGPTGPGSDAAASDDGGSTSSGGGSSSSSGCSCTTTGRQDGAPAGMLGGVLLGLGLLARRRRR